MLLRVKSKRGNLGFEICNFFELKSFDLQPKRKEMGWMAEALHRSIGNWTAGAITTCIGSKRKRKVVESQNVDQIARRCKVHT